MPLNKIDENMIDPNFARKIKGDTVNVKDFGALGNGIADDTEAIKSAVAKVMELKGGKVIIPTGIYKVTTQILIDLTGWEGNSFEMSGDGILAVPEGDSPSLNTKIFSGINNTSSGGLIRVITPDDTKVKVLIEGLTFTKPDSLGELRYGTFINVSTWRNVRIENCSFEGGDIQVLIDRTYGCAIIRCNFTLFNQAIWLKSAANTTVVDNCVIRDGRRGIRVDSTLSYETTIGVRIINNYIESLSDEGISFYGVRLSTIANNYLEAIDQSSTYITGKHIGVLFNSGADTNTEDSARNLFIGNSSSGSALSLLINAGFNNVMISDSLEILNPSGNSNLIISSDIFMNVQTLGESVTNEGITILGKGLLVSALHERVENEGVTVLGKGIIADKIITPALEESVFDTGIAVLGKGIIMENTITPTFLNGWVRLSPPGENIGYWKDPYGMVHLEGEISSGEINYPAFTLPEGYRPIHELKIPVNSNDLFGQVRITTNGDVIPRIGDPLDFSLAGISFRAYGY